MTTLKSSPLQGFSSKETDFYLFQFLSSFFKYSFSNLLLFYPNRIFAIYFLSNSLLLNPSTFEFKFTFHIFSNPSCYLTSTFILSLNLSTNFFAFSKSSSFSYILFSAMNPFQCTKYFAISYTFLLFKIFSTSYFSTSSTSTGFSSFTFCLFIDSLYLTTLLTFTTG